ncbi:MAG: hypothetical protein HEQ34_01665 [Sphingorhabdus sp.]|uniref:beta strand repeat-containing protein n=1 Tax=Sphingorhabdus sp. TaxID=1902408 RepID=UPI0025CD8EB2|nr:cadherin domain-containing protein [Sphingorhabdus sp.]MCO4090645.1 hypothetical protein [Sphingorhabdus sp.]
MAATTVSVGFESGFVGEYSNNAHQPVSIKTLQTLGIDSVTISQTTDNGAFGGSQGNDYAVSVKIQFSNGTTSTFPAAVNWRDTQGSTIHGIGLTVASGVNDGTTYTARNGFSKTYLLQFVGSTRTYSDTASNASSNVVSGNAATNGLLEALNTYRTSAPASTTPSGLTSTITAATPSISANGTSTTNITVQLKDVNGNNLTTGGNSVTVATTAGTLSSITDNGNGTYSATLTSSTSVVTATITGTVEGLAISDDAQVQFVSTSSVSGTLVRANGSAVSGRSVNLVNASSQVVSTATTSGSGAYSFTAVAPGTYSIQFEGSGNFKAKAKSSTGLNQGNVVSSVTVGSASTISNVDAVVIDPAGVIYNSTTRAPVANAVASLYFNDAKVSNSALDTTLGGANDQTTGADGAYSFILNGTASSGTYELRVVAPTGFTGTPSTAIAPSGTYTPSLGGGLELIQAQSTAPTGAQPTTYHLFFDFTIGANAAGTSNGVINNHIPIDPVVAAPVFTSTNATDAGSNPSYSFTYDENRASGAALGTVSATGTGTLSYSITSGNGSSWFAIDAATGAITLTAAGSTSLANDFETQANIQTLTVQVSDGTRTTTIEVKLNETNVDDTPPVITGPGGVTGATTSAISVNENQTAVTTPTADETVTWSLVGGEDVAKFAIDSTTGAFSFVAAPDYETPTDGTTSGSNTYIVQVKALDAAGNFSLQTITVTVLEVIDTGPVITGPSGGAGAAASAISVNENQTAVTQLAADETVTWSITGGLDVSKFAIAADGTITFVAAPNFESPTDTDRNNTYVLTVTALDTTGNTSLQTVTVTVLDVNDGGPAFTGTNATGASNAPAYSFAYAENAAVGATLGTVAATDLDGTAVTFSITAGNADGWFAINPSTGVITLTSAGAASLANDFEATPNLQTLTVSATDGTAATNIEVRLNETNVDDIAPAITGPSGTSGSAVDSLSVNEGQTTVVRLTAGKAVTWTITSGNDRGKFQIAADGTITFVAAPDFESPTDTDTNNTYVLTVNATDAAGNRSTQTITVTVLNIDDTAPAITGPSGGPGAAASALTITEGLTAVTRFTANESVTWSIDSGVDAAKFRIDAATGTIVLAVATDFENPTDSDRNNTYVVRIKAVDAAGNVSFQTLTVTITNVDEIARKLGEIGDKLRGSLRNYAAHGLSDMLAFNESLMASNDDFCADPKTQKALSGSARANENGANLDLKYAQRLSECSRPHQLFADAGLSSSRMGGNWNSRIFGALRFETKVNDEITLGLAALVSRSSDELTGFDSSSISDKSLQVNAYGRYRISDTLKTGAFIGFGHTSYDFALTESDGFDLNGSMTGKRQVYGWMLSGDFNLGETVVTTDAIISHAREKIGSAILAARYLGEDRSGIAFALGTVDVTRISIPVTAPLSLSGSPDYGSWSRLLLSPGLLCEDNDVQSSGLRCGYQLGAKFVSNDGVRGRFYADYNWESVAGMRRSLIGVGYAYRIGENNNLELAVEANRGLTAMTGKDNRAMLSIRLAQ